MDAPSAVVVLVEVWLENDCEILLDLTLDDAERAEVDLVGCDMEQLALVADGDVAGPLRVRVDGGALALPEIPLDDHTILYEHQQAVVGKLALRRCHVLQIVPG